MCRIGLIVSFCSCVSKVNPRCRHGHQGQGRPSPLRKTLTMTMMHFPPLFQISPLFSKNFQTLTKIFTVLPFPEKFLDFYPPKFLCDLFLSSTTNFEFPPYLPCFNTFLPCFAKIIIP